MILKSYGQEYSESYLTKKIGGVITVDKELGLVGTLSVDHALYAKKLGFNVSCYSYNMKLLPASFKDLKKPELKKGIERLLEEKEGIEKRILKTYTEMIEHDVDLKIRMPSMKDVKMFLEQKIPVILPVNTRVLYENNSPIHSGHFIVITGFNKNKFYYNNPGRGGTAEQISSEKLFFALSNNVLDSSAYLIAIKDSPNRS